MSDKILDIEQITYSRELFEAKPAKFVSYLIYIFISILIICLAWAYMNEIDIVARGQGIVRPSEQINTIRIEYTGKLNELNIYEGIHIEKGDILFELEHSTLDLQKQQYQLRIDELNDEIVSLKSFENSIKNSEELFDNQSTFNSYYKSRYNNYVQNMKYLEVKQESNKLNINKTNKLDIYKTQLSELEKELKLNELLSSSIKQSKDLNTDSNYNYKYNEYLTHIEQFENQINFLLINDIKNEELLKSGIISKHEYDKSKLDLENLKLSYNEYKLNYMTTLNEKISGIKESIVSVKSQIELEVFNGDILESEEINYGIQLEKYKLDTLISIHDLIIEKQNILNDLEVQLNSVIVQIDHAVVKSPSSGNINFIKEVSVGDYLSIGDEILTIIPDESENLTIDIALPNSEVSGIQVGDIVKFQFDALPFREFGEFKGVINSISSDIKIDNYGNSYYLVEAKLLDHQSISYKGENRKVKVGMSCNAYLVKEQKKVFYWLLEKINLKEVK